MLRFYPFFLLALLQPGCLTDDLGDGGQRTPWLTIRPEEFPPEAWIVWDETAPGLGRDLVGQAIERWQATGEMTPLDERQTDAVSAYLRDEWQRAGGTGTTGSYPVEYKSERVLVGIDLY